MCPTTEDNEKERAELRELLMDARLWPGAAEVLRSKVNTRGMSPKEIQDKLGVSQATVSRFMRGDPTPKALLANLQGLNKLLEHLGLSVGDLKNPSVGLLLCIYRPQCASIHFLAAGDRAVPFPKDPRSAPEQTDCRICGGPLTAKCPNPECEAPVVAGSHCPYCGHGYVAGVPAELHGLTGKRLVQACEERNAANRAAMQHLEGGLRT
jgi:transcriptional regulator with XRE-family HTH domain